MIDDVVKARLVVAALMAALVVGPVVLDACAFTCHDASGAAADTSEPTCHHVGQDEDVRLVPPPAACGHDHSPAPSITTSVRASSSDVSLPPAGNDAVTAACDIVRALASSHCSSPPGIQRKPALPLRV